MTEPQAVEKRSSSLGLRILTGVLLAGVSLVAMASGHSRWPISLVITVVMACVWEMRQLVTEKLMWPLAFVMYGAIYSIIMMPAFLAPWFALANCILGVGAVLLWVRGERNPMVAILIGFWISGCMGAALWLQQTTRLSTEPFALNLVFVVVPCLWAGDTLAYLVGKSIGKHKMAPSISPGKTWEGAGGHLIGSVACASFFGLMVHLPLGVAMACGALASVTGQAGDLLQSMLKRSAMVKDSGYILPGHGGVLDRIDSMLLAVPPQVFFLWLAVPSMFHVKP